MKANLTKTTKQGRTMPITDKDINMLQHIGRWWCLGADHIVRAGLQEADIKRLYEPEDDPDKEKERKRRHHTVRTRLGNMLNSNEEPLHAAYLARFGKAYWLSANGGAIIGAPFNTYHNHSNVSRVPHAWAAADVGMRIEREGFKIYSERETNTGETIDREEIWDNDNPLTPHIAPNNVAEKMMRPDMTIPTEDGKFIFVEVERKINGSKSYYERKLNSYYSNPRVAGIWYITDKVAIANRLNRVNAKVAPNHHPLHFLTIPMKTHEHTRYTTFTGWDKSDQLAQTLTNLGALPAREGDYGNV